ncbi:hypothetical protein P280DRAFT_552890 [Massarina eburnea CBS 473.64]|uniref:Heterokaryon incompatibility domain-containing protein n=1 Tax=Massarina eburnea CBS 473.64 TaxID=1395130 RepID=A0A6A6RN77_9PLEO|nr:hypothetical protein P280DRAFT_552890 [Massarina eburnea CBS 473.64]
MPPHMKPRRYDDSSSGMDEYVDDHVEHTHWDRKIKIDEKSIRYFFRVPSTIIGAFNSLRNRRTERVLWVDAISIYQKDNAEKSQQVPRVSEIYGEAKSVCVWLGEGDDDSRMAFKFIRDEVTNLEDFDKLCESPDAAPKWNAMFNLMKRPWFSRRWIVQEIALARESRLHCGRRNIPWQDIADAVQLFVSVESATHRLSEVIKIHDSFYHVPRWFEYVSRLDASLLVDATGTLFRYLKTEWPEPNAYFDYIKPYVDICADFVQFAINQQPDRTRALDTLCRPWAPEPPKDENKDKPTATQTSSNPYTGDRNKNDGDFEIMPSWIPQLHRASHNMIRHADSVEKMGGINADPLVGLPELNQRNYNAAGDKSIDLTRVKIKKRKNYHSIDVLGFVLDRVKVVEKQPQNGNIPKSWFEMAGLHVERSDYDHYNQDSAWDEFWRTLVADRGQNARNPPPYYARAFDMSLQKGLLATGSLNTTDLIDDMKAEEKDLEEGSRVAQRRHRMRKKSRESLQAIVKREREKLEAEKGQEGNRIHPPVSEDPQPSSSVGKADDTDAGAQQDLTMEISLADAMLEKQSEEPQSVSAGKKTRKGKADPAEDFALGRQESSGSLTCPHCNHNLSCQDRKRKNPPLRELSRPQRRRVWKDRYCQLMGEAFVYGVMDGEAIALYNRHLAQRGGTAQDDKVTESNGGTSDINTEDAGLEFVKEVDGLKVFVKQGEQFPEYMNQIFELR